MAAHTIQAHLRASSSSSGSSSSNNASATAAGTRRRPEEAVMAIVRRLVRAAQPSAGLNARNRDGDTILHACCKSGYAACVATLLREGAPHVDIDACTEGAFTPLAYAARGGHLGIVSALVGAGAETAVLQRSDARRFLPTDAVRRALVREAVAVGAAAYQDALRETLTHGVVATPFASMPEVLIGLVVEYVLQPVGGGGSAARKSSSGGADGQEDNDDDDGANDQMAAATAADAAQGILGLDE